MDGEEGAQLTDVTRPPLSSAACCLLLQLPQAMGRTVGSVNKQINKQTLQKIEVAVRKPAVHQQRPPAVGPHTASVTSPVTRAAGARRRD